ncbi:hypothetical protein B0T22DRAFT_438620 [Podospora appendiculata]|uniref:Uncharacterized protein n=1 Tax=Podospora appendiculata TaxID=314037 RepID=A0AAE1CIE3_9PEZI|nr:hypothetical protein B0T22DRAFT_438620 [Podospora appendiculata]
MSSPPPTSPTPLTNNQENEQEQQQPWQPSRADIQIAVEGPTVWRTRRELVPHPVLRVGIPKIPDELLPHARLTAEVKVVEAYGRDVRASLLGGAPATVVGVECPAVKPPSVGPGGMHYCDYYFVFDLMYLRAGKHWLHFTVRYQSGLGVGGHDACELGQKRTTFGCETTLSSPDNGSVPGYFDLRILKQLKETGKFSVLNRTTAYDD